MKVLLSIPVHDSIESVVDLVNNLRYFIPKCLICIHNSLNSHIPQDQLASQLAPYQGVYLSPHRLRNDKAPDQWVLRRAHLLNYRHMCSLRDGSSGAGGAISWDYVMFITSPSLCFRAGIKRLIKKHDFGGVSMSPTSLERQWSRKDSHSWGNSLRRDTRIVGYAERHGLSLHFSFHMGLFMKDEIMRWVATEMETIDSPDFRLGGWYPEEEIWFATVLARYRQLHPEAKVYAHTWHYRAFHYKVAVTPELLERLGREGRHFFVKRVHPRDAVREHLRRVTGRYGMAKARPAR